MHKVPKVTYVSTFAVETLIKNNCPLEGDRVYCHYTIGGKKHPVVVFYDGQIVDLSSSKGEIRKVKKRFVKLVTPNKIFRFPVKDRKFNF